MRAPTTCAEAARQGIEHCDAKGIAEAILKLAACPDRTRGLEETAKELLAAFAVVEAAMRPECASTSRR